MVIANIALGLLGLGIVVFVHELGHFLAARLVGIDVEAFSIGWGKPILKKKIGATEYRLGMFPVGGYCKMRGNEELEEAWEQKSSGVKPEKGTYYGATPLDRIIVAVAGPLFNLIFALLVMSVISGFGSEVFTSENRIILASEFDREAVFPADAAGFETGDRIVRVNRRRTSHSHEVHRRIAVNPERNLRITVERQGEAEPVILEVRPDLDRNTGMGRIGIFFWTDPVIGGIVPESNAEAAGLRPGDRIIRVNGEPVEHTIGFMRALDGDASAATIDFIREGVESTLTLALPEAEGERIGIGWEVIQYRTPSLSPPAALARGAAETWETFLDLQRGIATLFRGINLTQAVSGPVRITYMVGEVATEGFGHGFGAGLRSTAGFLAFISIALAVMNLLPLPILDGGLIVLSVVEIIRRKPTHPKALKVLQTIGMVLIFSLMIFALFGDILFLARR